MAFDLNDLGWDDELGRRLRAVCRRRADAGARRHRVQPHLSPLSPKTGELQAQHAGRLLHRAEADSLSAVGDWVAARPTPGEATATIEAVLPRRSQFSRKVAGELTEEQIVAANIDTVFLVMGLDGDYNPRRLERYLLLAYESGASPVVMLNKSDVADHLSEDMDEIRGLAVGIPVHAVSAKERTGHRGLRAATSARAGPARCSGSSGVGKSTLVNALIGEELLKTRDVRATTRAAGTPRAIAT